MESNAVNTTSDPLHIDMTVGQWANVVRQGRGREIVQLIRHHGVTSNRLFRFVHAIMINAANIEAGSALTAIMLAELIEELEKDW